MRGRLLELLTNTGRPKVRGRYDLALKAVESLTIQRDETSRRVAAARAQRDGRAEFDWIDIKFSPWAAGPLEAAGFRDAALV